MLPIVFYTILLGILASIAVFSYKKSTILLYWLWDKAEIVVKRLFFVKELLEEVYFRYWKIFKLPNLKKKTRQGDLWALAERLKYAKHSNLSRRAGKGVYEKG